MADNRRRLTRPTLIACIATLAASPAMAQLLTGDGSLACGGAYTVASGDTLSSLSGRAYGDPQLYNLIAEANRDNLGGNAENIAVGMALTIPCVDASGAVLSAEAAADQAASIQAAIAAEGPLTPDQLDSLFGPVALFPDPVLSKLLVAVTFPLDVVKAGRFVAESAGLSDKERASKAATQPWDPSVRDMAAAFPDLVTRMSDHIDWTEQAGEAIVAQTDDALASIQRLRAEAQANGYLVDNEAQKIQTTGDTIYIAPANPSVVYVPTYDSQVVYTTPATAPPVYHYDNYDDDWDDVLLTGGIMLGSAIILDEIFDDDDWDDWGDWDNDVDVDWNGGDISIDRGDITVNGGNVINGGNIGDGNIGNVNIGDRDRPGALGKPGDRVGLDGKRTSIGDLDRPQIGNRPEGAASIASQARRDAARETIKTRQSSGDGIAKLPATRPAAAKRPDVAKRPDGAKRPAVAATRPTATPRKAAVSKPAVKRSPAARTPSRSSAFSRPSGGSRASAASSRGRSSAGGRSGGGRRR